MGALPPGLWHEAQWTANKGEISRVQVSRVEMGSWAEAASQAASVAIRARQRQGPGNLMGCLSHIRPHPGRIQPRGGAGERDIVWIRGRTQLPRANAKRSPELPLLPLREHRLRLKVSLESIMERTKISRRFLEAIENGEYRELPGGVFSINYIRQYAELVGYDAELILEDYRKSVGGMEPAAGRKPQQQEARWVRFFEFG